MADIERVESRHFALQEISVGSRLRPASAAGVEVVRASINEIGQIVSPIWVRKTKAGYELLDGLHRLEAARAEGLNSLPGIAFRCSDTQARLLEIDGNLAGSELSALDTAVFLAARKRIYGEQNPHTTHGGDRRSPGYKFQTDTVSTRSYAAAAAEKFGLTDRHIRRLISAGEALGPDEIQRLRNAPSPITLKDLQTISKIGRAPERYYVVEALEAGHVKSAAAARTAWKAAENGTIPAIKDPDEEAFIALMNTWKRAPKAARRRFAERIADDLEHLTEGADE